MGKAKKFGTFGGVFTPSVLAILGVIMYLRLPWIVGQTGLWPVLGIIIIAHIITICTGLSVSSVATDKRVETGGSYYIISRSLGLPIGGTLGVALFVGFSFSVSLYLIGFAETFLNVFGMELSLHNIRITGAIVLLLVTALTFISTSLAIKSQYLIMGAIVLSLLSIFFGSHDVQPQEPLMTPATDSLPWIALFAIFFPAVTGFQAGVSMSGDLKNPRKAIPLGTMMAILVGFLVYGGLALFFAFTVDRELLLHDPAVLFQISMVPELVIAGILAATLSSAMVSILGAPRVLQAVAMDRILPGFFARGHGASNEPRNALLVAFVIALTGIVIGELNVIARIVTIFFIITYGFLNITYAIESWAGSDFRPSFKIPRFVSIVGALACIVVMIQLDIAALIVASVVLMALFGFLKKKELSLQSGDTWTGVWLSVVKTALARLMTSDKKTRHWRPNVMLFSGGEKNRPHMIEMGRALVGKMGVFTNFELTEQPSGDILSGIKDLHMQGANTIRSAGMFTRRHTCRDIYEGIDIIARVYGFAGFEPNTVLMGWARKTRSPEKYAQLVNSLQRQDYNCVFLHYDAEKRFGAYKSIDFWWNGDGRELTLTLHLLRFITASDRWRTARIRLLAINNASTDAANYYNLINRFLEQYRLKAGVKVINNNLEQLSDEKIISAESRETDLTILELPDFDKKEPTASFEKTNSLSQCVSACLFVSASSSFEEVKVLKDVPGTGEEKRTTEITARPSAQIIQNVVLSADEVIAGQVRNAGQNAAKFLGAYFDGGIERIMSVNDRFFQEMKHFTRKMVDGLEKAASEKNPAKRSTLFLRVLNDYSFQTQRQTAIITRQKVDPVKSMLEVANLEYLDALRAMMNVMPERIRVKRSGKELLKKTGHPLARVPLYGRLLPALILQRQLSYRIQLLRPARYYLYHQRLKDLHRLMGDFSIHSFSELAEIRKLYNNIHELIEKTRLEKGGQPKMLDRINMERSRLIARIQVLETENRQFHYSAGQKLFENLVNDLQKYNDTLENNRRNRNLDASLKEIPALIEDLSSFAAGWEQNMQALINNTVIDFTLLSLKSRIRSKIQKHINNLYADLQTGLLRQADKLVEDAKHFSEDAGASRSTVRRLDYELLEGGNVQEMVEGLYGEVGELISDIPDKMEHGGEQLSENTRETAFSVPDRHQVSFRKTVEYFVGTELIDNAVNHSYDMERNLQQVVQDIRDHVRLLNFRLENEIADDTPAQQASKQQRNQLQEMAESFAREIEDEKNKILRFVNALERSFEEGLKRAFDPLSAATLQQSDKIVRKKSRETERGGIAGNIQQQWRKTREAARDGFVELLYSKSEGQLWISHLEKTRPALADANRRILEFTEKLTPDPAVLRELPFYYCSLFSGQSGTSDDFWVGMKDELNECLRAVDRLKAGYPGALIITGARTSGKSGLSRKVAERSCQKENIHHIRPPKSATACEQLFRNSILEALNAHNNNIDDVFRALPGGKAIIIQDLELWWEHRQGGDAVVERITDLVDHYGHKCLFIITVNQYALEQINRQVQLDNYALAAVSCQPFDARQLKEMILLRHHAGGIKLKFNKKDEDSMTEWDYARLFNDLFALSFGNPGIASLMWLSSIKKGAGKTWLMGPFRLPANNVFDGLTPEQWLYIRLFLLHRCLSAGQMAETLEMPAREVLSMIKHLQRTGILAEGAENIYAIRPGLDLFLAEQLKRKNRL